MKLSYLGIKENWVWEKRLFAEHSRSYGNRCLVQLSNGGRDAQFIRSLNLKSQEIRSPDGLYLGRKAKSGTWRAQTRIRFTVGGKRIWNPDSLHGLRLSTGQIKEWQRRHEIVGSQIGIRGAKNRCERRVAVST